MFFIKPKEGKMLYIYVNGTTRCDTGCKHCYVNSGPEGEDMDIGVIKRLAKSISKFKGQVFVWFVGGGEPLLWPLLPEAIKTLRPLSFHKVKGLRLFTSGALKDDGRLPILKKALEADPYLKFTLSFNLYSPSFPDRIQATLPYIFENAKSGVMSVNMVDRHGESLDELEAAIRKSTIGEFRAIPIIWQGGLPPKLERYLRCPFPLDLVETIMQLCSVSSTVYAFKDFPGKLLRVHPEEVKYSGRGRSLRHFGRVFANTYCEALDRSLYLMPDGNFVPCFNPEFPAISLGKAGGDLSKIFKKKISLMRSIDVWRLEIEGRYRLGLCESCVLRAHELVFEKLGTAAESRVV
jgi:hypothetical protein